VLREVQVESAPTLTIGMPVYNGAKYIAEAVESILTQTYRDFELIISDNASTDDTESICRAFAARDPRVTCRRNRQNVGLSANNNLLVPLARGRLFKWAPSDDVLQPEYLERCVAVLDADPNVVLVHPGTQFVDETGAPLDITDPGWHLVDDDPSARLLVAIRADRWMNAILGVIRTDALRSTRLLPRYAGGDDRLIAELSLLGKFVEVPERLYVRRIHKGSTAGNTGNTRWLRAYWSGSRRGMNAPFWRLSRDRAGIVMRAPIPLSRKAVLLAWHVRTMRYGWRRLLGELVEAARG
jgi:glycosyltransferase involved in cell wall biosynthesis